MKGDNTMKTSKKVLIQYCLLLGGLAVMLILSLLPYATIDFDGKYRTSLGFFNAILNLDGNDMVTIYRIVSITLMAMIDIAFILYAVIGMVFALINLGKCLKRKDFSSSIDYMFDNYENVLVKGVLAIVICSILGQGVDWYAPVLLALSLALPIAVIAMGDKLSKGRLYKVLSLGSSALAAVLLSVSFTSEFNLNTILNGLNSASVKAGAVFAILLGISAVLVFQAQKNLLKDERAATIYGKVTLGVSALLGIIALIVNVVAGALGVGAIVALVVVIVLFLISLSLAFLADKDKTALVEAHS